MSCIVQYMLPFVINQSGSVLYYLTLSSVGKWLHNIVSLSISVIQSPLCISSFCIDSKCLEFVKVCYAVNHVIFAVS